MICWTTRLVGCVVAVTLFGCAPVLKHRPLPVESYRKIELQAILPDRFWGDEAPANLEAGVLARLPVLRELYPNAIDADLATAPYRRLLAISGGGADGAFGAGILAGWSESGERVAFDVVTGVSTGAIIAPFAFLGPDYDETIIDIYASGTADRVFELAIFSGLFLGPAAADTTPLREQIDQHITPELVAKIADEHAKARDLFIVTTHFDAGRPVVWDVGAIATRRDMSAVRLIRQIVQASAAIPAFFPPVPIEIEVDGELFTELHVDGGLSHNVFAYPAQIPVSRLNEILDLTFRREIYVIQNANDRSRYSPAPTRVVPIARRAVSTLLQNQLNADVERIFRLSRRDGVGFKMVAIPDSFDADGATDFDPAYMRALIELGREMGRSGDFWSPRPRTVADDE